MTVEVEPGPEWVATESILCVPENQSTGFWAWVGCVDYTPPRVYYRDRIEGWRTTPSRTAERETYAVPLVWGGTVSGASWDLFRRWALGHSEEDDSEGREYLHEMWPSRAEVRAAAKWAETAIGGFSVIVIKKANQGAGQ
jgi:hypothetical protein